MRRIYPDHIEVAVLAGVTLASIVVAVGLPWLLTGELRLTSWTVKVPLLAAGFTAFGWFVWRIRGSEIRKHGGWQAWPPTMVMAAVVGLLLLTGCSGNPIDPARRSNAQTLNTTTQQRAEPQPTPAPTQQAAVVTPCPNGVVPPPTPDLIWCDDSVPNCRPTPDFKPAKYPCASNAEIDAWLQGDVNGSGK